MAPIARQPDLFTEAASSLPAGCRHTEDFLSAADEEALLAEIEKRKFELDPTSGEELDKIVKDAMGQPPEIVGRMKKFLGG